MDGVFETPPKRRKLNTEDASQRKEYDSDNDSGDYLFDEAGFETIATLPLQANLASTQPSYTTQPTQIISHQTPRDVLQVSGSSPRRDRSPPKISNPTGRTVGGILASAMAPPGTTFRPPLDASRAAPPAASKPRQVIDLLDSDDDMPRYQGASSDEDTQQARRADIKPSSFKASTLQAKSGNSAGDAKSNSARSSSSVNGHKSSILDLSSSYYNPKASNDRSKQSQHVPLRGSADIMANAYGSAKGDISNILVRRLQEQTLQLDEIEDYQARTKVVRMRNILPNASVSDCYNALIKKRGNYDDAMELVISIEETRNAVDSQQTGVTKQRTFLEQKKPAAKQQIKVPNQSIQEKWAATQNFSKPSEKSSSPPLAVPKPRRRLVQGRKTQPHAVASPVIISSRHTTPLSDTDSGLGSELEDTYLDEKLLTWLNSCSVSDLSDCAETSKDVANLIISHRPFKTLQQVRSISQNPNTKKTGKTRPVGDKVVDKCSDMWNGYNAIDQLVKQCSELGDTVQKEMGKWGVDFSGTRDGELDITDLEVSKKSRDSGVGTPTSRDISADEADGNDASGHKNPKSAHFIPQPSIMAPGTIVKDYQLVGMNWLALLFRKGLSCILADDMGLGKTCQVISFLAHLYETGVKGPHLIIVPGSTLENWLREFQTFCPKLTVMPYYAGLNERPGIQLEIEDNISSIDVIVTTYGIAKVKQDNSFLRKLKPICTIYDEGHLLRNSKSAGYDQYMRIPCQFRLLLTGTPLQNNLRELASLLGFILPSMFKEHRDALEAIFSHKAKTSDTQESHAALLSTQRIQRAKTMMTPFVLRRKKHQVLKHLPAKHRSVQHCDLSATQRKIYDDEKARAVDVIARREAGEKTGAESTNVMMNLRKASIHPLLFRQIYDDQTLHKMSKACLKEVEFAESNVNLVFEDMSVMTDMELHQFCVRYPKTVGRFRLTDDEWMDSGKVQAMTQLLHKYKANGDRVLIFSQFVMVLNILESVMETLDMQFFRLDGATKIEERQDMIDQFYKEPEITVFLLSTGAGGAGINLACANKVIIFDSSFNPQTDIQAENRAHRVGQTREVEVVRLVTRDSIEEQILALGETKLALDDRVAGVSELEDGKAEKEAQKMVTEMMMGQIKDEGARAVKDGEIAK